MRPIFTRLRRWFGRAPAVKDAPPSELELVFRTALCAARERGLADREMGVAFVDSLDVNAM